MDTFEPQQPDEGYSEAPLSGSGVLTAKSSGSGATPLPHALLQHINSLSESSKIQLVETLLESLPTHVIAQIVQKLSPRLYIDFIRYLPPEICLKILGYLDPLSLIVVARSCRSWYGLALDRQLWEALYYLEGWKTIAPSLRLWEELVNHNRPVASEGSRLSKRRAITSLSRRTVEDERDHVMLDAHPELPSTSPSPAVSTSASTSTSIFGSSASSSASTMVASQQPLSFSADDDGQQSTNASSSSNRKGKQRASSPLPQAETGSAAREDRVATPSDSLATLTSPMAITNNTLPRSTLWVWDPVGERYRLNWKHLYTLRRRLELNWDLGKFTNFQFPHPNHPEEAHGECIYTLQFNSDYLVSGSRDRTIRIWSMKTRRLVQKPLVDHKGSVLCLQFDSDPEEDLIVSGSSDSNVILWKFSTGNVIQRLTSAHREPVLNVKFDKNILVTCSKDKTIKIFNRRPLKPGDLGYDSLPGVASSAAVNPVPVQLKNYTDGSALLGQMPIKPAYSMLGILEGHSAAVNAVQIHGREIVSASGDRNVKIWDWPNQSCVRTLIGHSKGIACVQYDGRRIVSGSSDNEVKVFDRMTGLEVASLRAHKNLVRTVQAGFGDLPYSQDEDEKAAARFDAKYQEYRQTGRLREVSAHPSQRRLARAQATAEAAAAAAAAATAADDEEITNTALEAVAAAGAAAGGAAPTTAAAAATTAEDDDDFMMRPENIRFTGAKLPPGGGGGQYGRIVSGSYDTTIIIWRRDRRGVWKAQHHLRQEEAAVAAAAAAAAATATATATAESVVPAPREPLYVQIPSTMMRVNPLTLSAAEAQEGSSPLTYHQMNLATVVSNAIEQDGLPLTLAAHPELLETEMGSILQTAITRHPSPFVRSQLQGVVAAARQRARNAQYDQGLGTGPGYLLSNSGVAPFAIIGSPSVSAGPSSSAAPAAPFSMYHPLHPSPPSSAPQAAANPAVDATAAAAAAAAAAHTHHMQPPQQQQAPFPHMLYHQFNHGAAAAAAATATATAIAAGAGGGGGGDHGASNPARVFKLQFDARQIICCSQAAVIVGWDFCNGDPELEEASKFFGTLD